MTFDPLVEERVSPTVTVERNEKQDPLIVPRGGTEAIPYTRASSLCDMLSYYPRALSDWRGRYEAQGIARFRDLAARAAAVYYSTGPLTGNTDIGERKRAAAELDAVREEAAQRMGINEAANLGTAGHSLTEPGNPGLAVEENLINVVKGYHEVTAGLERVASEVFVANDALRSAGTFDSGYISPEYPGFIVIGDTKTGKNYHQAQFEVQLAVYQGGEVYLSGGGRLTFEEYFGLPVHADVAYLVHVSITGSPKPRIVKLDLARGRRLAQLAADARDGRTELDKVGIGEKVDHRGLAVLAMERGWDALCAQERDLTTTEFRAKALALHARFAHIWPEEYTFAVKVRLDNG